MTWRKRHKKERKNFNNKLKDNYAWNDVFSYPFISEIIEVCFPKINVSTSHPQRKNKALVAVQLILGYFK